MSFVKVLFWAYVGFSVILGRFKLVYCINRV